MSFPRFEEEEGEEGGGETINKCCFILFLGTGR